MTVGELKKLLDGQRDADRVVMWDDYCYVDIDNVSLIRLDGCYSRGYGESEDPTAEQAVALT